MVVTVAVALTAWIVLSIPVALGVGWWLAKGRNR